MTYVVHPASLEKVQLTNKLTRTQEILQNVALILCTPKGSLPLDREFGTDQSYVDKPPGVARTMLVAEVKEAMELEPRVELVDLSFDHSESGKLTPMVEVKILES